MNAKNLGILAGLTAVVGGLAAVAVWRERSSVAARAETGVVLPELKAKINEVSTIEVVSGEKSLTVHRDPARADAPWTVKELGDYPAKFEKVKGVLVALAGLEKVEAKTDQAEQYEKIGVQEPAPANTAMLVKVSNASGPAASLIVGKNKSAGSTQQVYVRVPGQKQSWLASGELGATAEPMQWVDAEIMKIDSTRMKSAAVTQADGARLEVSRPTTEGLYTVANIPEGRKLKTENAASPVAGGLAYLNFEGVKPVAEVAWDPEQDATAEFRTFDGLVVTVTTVEADGKVWARFGASFDESAVAPAVSTPPDLPPKADGTEPTEEERAASAKQAQEAAETARKSEIDRVKNEAESLGAKVSPWAYQIAKAKGDQFRRKIEDLLAEAPADGTDEDAGQPEEMEDPFGAPADEPLDLPAPDDGGG